MKAATTSDRIANVQVWRDRSFTSGSSEPEITYSIGWGRSGRLEGDPMTREELETLYRLIRQALDESTDRAAAYAALLNNVTDPKLLNELTDPECKLICVKLPERG